MNNENNQTNELQPKKSLAEALLRLTLPPQEKDVYQSCMEQQLWSIDEFAALIGGITPENYKKGTKGSTEITDAIFAKRVAHAIKIFTRFLEYIDKNSITNRDFILTDENMFWSSWRFIKWIAENDVRMNNRFFDALPLSLKELYWEFQPINMTLRTASHYSRAYHKALYLHHAQKLLEIFPNLKPTKIYRDPHMKNIERYMRELGGSYKKRTLVASWLPEIIESPIGRPEKQTC